MLNKNYLKLVILPGKNPPGSLAKHYNAAYECWKSTWQEAALELTDIPRTLDSNEFIRQDEVMAVFDNDKCTSLGFWTEIDFNYLASRQDSYFRSWTPKTLEKLTRDGSLVGKYSYLTVAKDYRKTMSDFGFSFKDLQIGVFARRFLESAAVSMTGTTRNNKGVNQVCARGGAMLIESNLVQHGVGIDLMVWYRDIAKPHSSVADLVEFLWTTRFDYRYLTNEKTNNPKEGTNYGSAASA